MKRHIKSDDPRKKSIVAALKAKAGANKVTQVYQIGESEFQGDCLKGNRSGYLNLGTFNVTNEEIAVLSKEKIHEVV